MSAADGFSAAAGPVLADPARAVRERGVAVAVCFDARHWQVHEAAALGWLSVAEQERAARFRFATDRSSYVMAHAFWRLWLSLALDLVPDTDPLTFTPAGQPVLAGAPFATSLSHSGGQVAMLLAPAPAAGVDIECDPPRRPLGDIAEAFCTPNEQQQLSRLPAAGREIFLLRLWTRKEAVLKAFGTGLGHPPTALDVPEDGIVASPPALRLPDFRVGRLALPSALAGAWALPRTLPPPRLVLC